MRSRLSRVWSILAAMACLTIVPARAARQGAPATSPDPSTALILGRVVDGASDRAVPNVIVTLSGGSAAAPGSGATLAPARPRRAVTDSSGRFLFHDLPAGRYTFSVSSVAGIVPAGYGMRRPGGASQPLDLASGERAGDVTINMWRQAAISGTLLDQRGDPVVETRVGALKVEVVAGRRRYRTGPLAATDDRGMFRISRIDAGEYVVYVPFAQVTVPFDVQAEYDRASAGGQAARNDFERSIPGVDTMMLNGSGVRFVDLMLVRTSNGYGADGPIGPMFDSPPPDDTGRILVYPFTYYPATTSLADATTISVGSGEERTGVDLQVRLVPAVRVSGRVTGPDGPASMVAVRLVPQSALDAADETALEAATTVTKPSGEFTFLGVPAGQYLLKIARVPNTTRPTTMTSVTVGTTTMFSTAPDPNLPPLPLPDTPTLGASVPVTVGDRDLNDLAVALTPGARISGRVDYHGSAAPLTADQIVRATITLDPVDGRSFTGAAGKGQFNATGQFKTLGLLPGRYVLRVGGSLGSWTLESATIGGRDISDSPVAVEAADVNGVVVTLTDHPAAIAGTARDAGGAADPNAIVLAFPADRDRWTDVGASPRRLRSARVSPKGAYSLDALPAGDYFVIAIDDRASANWQDPRRLAVLAGAAARVTVASGERRTVDLKTEAVR